MLAQSIQNFLIFYVVCGLCGLYIGRYAHVGNSSEISNRAFFIYILGIIVGVVFCVFVK